MWLIKQMYELIDNSFEVVIMQKKMLINAYERGIIIKREIENIHQNEKMKKYATLAVKIVDKVLSELTLFISKNRIFLLLCNEAKHYFARVASPQMVSTFVYLQRNYWLDFVLVPIITSKHYYFWRIFWEKFLISNLSSKYGEDICRKIAEFIPQEIKGSSFIDYFRKHYNMQNDCFLTDERPFELTSKLLRGYGEYCNYISVFIKN